MEMNCEVGQDRLMDQHNVATRKNSLFLIKSNLNLLQIFLVNEVYFSNVPHHFDGVFLPLVFQLLQDIVEYYLMFFVIQ